jgi:hypothetical protein
MNVDPAERLRKAKPPLTGVGVADDGDPAGLAVPSSPKLFTPQQ